MRHGRSATRPGRWRHGASLLGVYAGLALGAAQAQPQKLDPAADPGPAASAPALPLADKLAAPEPAPAEPGGGFVLVPAAPPVAAAPPPPLRLEAPQALDAVTLGSAERPLRLFGVAALPGEGGPGLQAFIAASGNRVECTAQAAGTFTCTLPDGTDVAAVALVNGVARATPEAPPGYAAQEAAAQEARRGFWATLPPPPVQVLHPVVRDTATLLADGQVFVLEGLQGLGAPYAAQLQGFILANGDALSCQPQAMPGTYMCMLPDGNDLAKVALVNGAARVGPDAPDSYRLQQREAMDNRRGFWLGAPPALLQAERVAPKPADCCVFLPGDDGVNGIDYVGGVPTAKIDGETVFLVFAGVAGWGYYDRYRRWRAAPEPYYRHLDRFHPEGRGLRGYYTPGGGGFHPGGPVYHPGSSGAPWPATRPGGGGGYGGGTPAGGRPGGWPPGAGMAPGGVPGGPPGGGFAGGVPPGVRPGGAPPAGGMAPGGVPGGPPGGGFAGGVPPGGRPGGVPPVGGMAPGGVPGGPPGGGFAGGVPPGVRPGGPPPVGGMAPGGVPGGPPGGGFAGGVPPGVRPGGAPPVGGMAPGGVPGGPPGGGFAGGVPPGVRPGGPPPAGGMAPGGVPGGPPGGGFAGGAAPGGRPGGPPPGGGYGGSPPPGAGFGSAPPVPRPVMPPPSAGFGGAPPPAPRPPMAPPPPIAAPRPAPPPPPPVMQHPGPPPGAGFVRPAPGPPPGPPPQQQQRPQQQPQQHR